MLGLLGFAFDFVSAIMELLQTSDADVGPKISVDFRYQIDQVCFYIPIPQVYCVVDRVQSFSQ
uniref:Uncharacterized protein n=1 Tax=Manihot esculenta TaxID=3983 RepID=A0A2C9WI99_MANES